LSQLTEAPTKIVDGYAIGLRQQRTVNGPRPIIGRHGDRLRGTMRRSTAPVSDSAGGADGERGAGEPSGERR
jgi:hypothetical protein